MIRRVLLSLALLAPALIQPCAAQDRSSATWYFGRHAGLSFATDPPTPITDGATTNIEGTSVICDSRTGVILFYTDGSTIWDHNHVAKATGIGGSVASSTQGPVIVPHPGDPTRFYVFTVEDESRFPNSEGRVTEVRVQGGEVISVGTPLTLLTGVAEKVTAAKGCNGLDYWVIYRLRNRGFAAYQITRTNGFSVGSRVNSPVGLVLPLQADGRGEMKVSPDGNWIASASEMVATEVFRFNNATGVVSNALAFEQGEQRYGLSFSPSSRFLYVNSGWKATPVNHIYQYDMNAADIAASRIDVATAPVGVAYGDMQIGTNGKIYVARYNTQYLAAIDRPEARGVGCNYIDQSVQFPAGSIVYWGLPNVPQNFFVPQLTGADTSACDSSVIRVGVPPLPGFTYQWSPGRLFDDSVAAQPRLTVNGTTTVTLRATDPRGCDIVQTLVVRAIPLPSLLTGADTTICRGSVATLRATSPTGVSYTWSPTIGLDATTGSMVHASPPSTTTYRAMVMDQNGCTTTRSVTVTVNSLPTPSLAPRDTVSGCASGAVVLNAGTGYTATRWSTGAITPQISVNTSGSYWVEVEDANGCTGRDTVYVAIGALPTIVTNADTTICAGTTARLRASGGMQYQWAPTNGLDDATRPDPTATLTTSTTYTVVVTAANGCTDSARVTIDVRPEPHPSLAQADTTICACDSIVLRIPSGYTQPRWNTGDTTAALIVRTPGSYTARIVDQYGCEGTTDTVTIQTLDPVAKINVGVTPTMARDNVPVAVTLTLLNAAELAQCLGQNTTISLVLNSTILAPTDSISRGTIDPNSAQRTVYVQLSSFVNDVATLSYVSTLGRVDSTPIRIDGASSPTCAAGVEATSTSFTLDEICRAGGIARRYLNRVAPVIIAPNPASGAATLIYMSDGLTPVHVDLVDVTGRVVGNMEARPSTVGRNTLLIDLHDLPDGMYTVVCTAMQERSTLSLGVRQ